MCKKLLHATLLFAAILGVTLILAVGTYAAPYDGEVFHLKQPDNTVVEVKVWGDEFYQRVESPDGYTLCRDPKTNWICYAELNADASDFVSTGIIYKGPSSSGTLSVKASEPAKPQKGLKLKKDKILKKAELKRKELFVEGEDPAVVNSSYSPVMNAPLVGAPVVGATAEIKGLTILIDFSDVPATIPKQDIENMVNMPGYTGYSNNGSVRDYFYDVSGGAMNYTNIVTAYYRAVKPKTYYNDPNATGRARELVVEALTYLKNSGFDFTPFTKKSNGMIAAVNIFYSGNPDVGWSKGLWPHSGSISTFTVSGGYISRYQMSSLGSSLSIGTFIHENGHMVCGYPDLYDYNQDSKGVGSFCVMCNSGGKNPVPPNPYFRSVISGWGSVTELKSLPNNSQVSVKSATLDVYRYSGPYTNEFFMVENIRKKGRWTAMPDEGLIIWHVETKGSNDYQDMTLERHYKVSVEQADGQFHFEKNVNTSSANDLFHLGNADKFNDTTIPNSKWWNGTSSGLNILNISGVADTMTFTIQNANQGPTYTPVQTMTPTPVPTRVYTPTPTPTPRPSNTPTATLKPTNTPTPTLRPSSTPTPTPTNTPPLYSISGYVSTNFASTYAGIKEGFLVEAVEINKSALSSASGYFKITGIPYSSSGYTLRIGKRSYLTRTIPGVAVLGNTEVVSEVAPIEMWAGDVPIDGSEDGAINMADIMQVAKGYNSMDGNPAYNVDYDINRDGVINMNDIMIIASQMNKVSSSYPGI